jgi:hypothetical protein
MDWKTRKQQLQDNGIAADSAKAAVSSSSAQPQNGINEAARPTADVTEPRWVPADLTTMTDDDDASADGTPGPAVSLDAFAPYQPEKPEPADNVASSPFIFQPMGQFHAPAEPVITEPSTIFANKPEPPPGLSAAKNSGPIAANFAESLNVDEVSPSYGVSAERDNVASGLVTQDDDLGIPRVAPFIVDMPGAPEPVDVISSERVLILKVRNLSASYPLTNETTTMGRPDAETQSYPDVEIELDDSVSRKHAEVRRKGSDFYLVDLGSTNGTMLNGQELRPGVEMLLQHGDRIRMGEKTELVFE